MKTFKPYPLIKNGFSDSFFETISVNRLKDDLLDEFLRTKIENNETLATVEKHLVELKKGSDVVSVEVVFPFIESLIEKVSDFFGGFVGAHVLEPKMKAVIKKIQKDSGWKNIVPLGSLKNNGICRHRAILFKIICDILHIRCRLVRGVMFFNAKDPKTKEMKLYREEHCWNIVHLQNDFFVVDCMNYPKIQKEYFLPWDKSQKVYFKEKSTKKRLSVMEEKEKLYEDFFIKKFNVHGDGGKAQFQEETGGISTIWRMEIPKMNEKKDEEEEVEGEEDEVSNLFPNGATVAVKVTSIKKLPLRYLEKEASIIKSIDHENIIKYFCSYRFPNNKKPSHFCLVLEYLPHNGDEFLELLQSLDPTKQTVESLIFLLQAARGLRHLHDNGYLHLDLKPSNIILSWDEKDFTIQKVKLIDFAGSKEKNLSVFTQTLFQGSNNYLAPDVKKFIEKFTSSKVGKEKKKNMKKKESRLCKLPFDESADVYSFGKLMNQFMSYLDFSKDMLDLANQCTRTNPKERPVITLIIHKLMRMLEFMDEYLKK